MREEIQKCFDEIQKRREEFNIDVNILCTHLQADGYFTKDEVDIITNVPLSTGKLITIFSYVKSKPNEVILSIQQLCINTKWTDLLNMIQSRLNELGFENLIWQPSVSTKEKSSSAEVKLLNNSNEILIPIKNIHFDLNDPSFLFTGREQELIQLHNLIQPSLITSDASNVVRTQKCTIINGLGGTGKTQLVLRYAQLYNGEYGNNILWINAESNSTITSSFQHLASEKLNLNLKTVEGKEKTISTVVFEVYKFFSNTKALFIFDNADGPFSEHFFPTGDNKPFILITSRTQQWDQFQVFKLNTFTEPDAIQFVKKGLKITNETQEDNIKNLVKLFQNFPLALQQAVAFITETNEDLQCIRSEYNIANYLIDYKVKAKSLPDQKINSYMGSQSSVTTYTTWKVTIDKIMQNKKHGELSTKIFNLISCFACYKINPQIFLPLTEGNVYKLTSALKLLIKYSMVNQVDRLLNVHPLVQEITLSDLSISKHGMEECLQDAQNLLLKYYSNLLDNFSERHQFVLPHIESLLTKIKAWTECNAVEQKRSEQESLLYKSNNGVINNPEMKKISVREIVFNLLQCLIDGYFYYDCKKTISLLEELLRKKEEHFGPDHYQVASTLNELGVAYGNLGDSKMMKDFLERALAINEKHYGPDHYQVSSTLYELGRAHSDLGNPKRMKDFFERALAIYRKHYGPDHYQVASALHCLGCAYGDLGDPKKMKDYLEKALAINEKHYGSDHYQVASTLHELGRAHGDLGDPKMMKDYLERAMVIYEEHYGPDHYQVASTLHNLGYAHGDLGDKKIMKDYLERALAIKEKYYGPDHYQVASTLHELGYAHGNLGDPKMMKGFLERALAIKQKHYGPDHYQVASTLRALGCAYGDLGDPKMMKDFLERALVINKRHYGPEHYQVAITLQNLGCAHGALGDQKMKKYLLERALAIKEKHYGSDHYQVVSTLHELGHAYSDLGDAKMKKDLLERALAIKKKHSGSDHYQEGDHYII